MHSTTIESIPVKTNDRNIDALEVCAYYSLGGANMSSYRNEPRGYYISVTPVKYIACSTGRIIESHPLDGIKKCFIECNRQSAKKAQTAISAKREDYQDLINYVLNKTNLELAETVA